MNTKTKIQKNPYKNLTKKIIVEAIKYTQGNGYYNFENNMLMSVDGFNGDLGKYADETKHFFYQIERFGDIKTLKLQAKDADKYPELSISEAKEISQNLDWFPMAYHNSKK